MPSFGAGALSQLRAWHRSDREQASLQSTHLRPDDRRVVRVSLSFLVIGHPDDYVPVTSSGPYGFVSLPTKTVFQPQGWRGRGARRPHAGYYIPVSDRLGSDVADGARSSSPRTACAKPSTPRPTAGDATRILLRPIATPFPLGFLALATASLLVAGLELGWFARADQPLVAIVLIGFAFPLQLMASGFGFLGRDTVAATGFGVQGGTWLIVGIGLLMTPPQHMSHALGVFLLAAAAWVLICALGSALGKLAPATVLVVTSLRFLLTGLYELTGSSSLGDAAAIVGLILVAVAAFMRRSRWRSRTSRGGRCCPCSVVGTEPGRCGAI